MVFPTLLGAAVLAGIVNFLLRAHSRMWRIVASSYAADFPHPVLARKSFEQALIAGGGLAFRNYVPLTVGIHEKGMSLRLLPPFSLQCPPLFLPFDEMSCRRTDWFLSHDVFAIKLARVDVDIIVSHRLWSWIQSQCGLELSYARDPGN